MIRCDDHPARQCDGCVQLKHVKMLSLRMSAHGLGMPEHDSGLPATGSKNLSTRYSYKPTKDRNEGESAYRWQTYSYVKYTLAPSNVKRIAHIQSLSRA